MEQDHTEQDGTARERVEMVTADLGARLDEIEDSPLHERAAAYSQVQEELRLLLENADRPR